MNDTQQLDLNEEEYEMENKYLTFHLDKHIFGIPISKVVEIISMQEITPVLEYPKHIKGIINLRGRIISVIDIRIRFKKEEIPYDERTCIIVIDIGGRHVGFIVDRVREVMDIALKSISNRPHNTNNTVNDYLTGFAKIENKVILMLDTDKILYDSDFPYL